MKLNFHVTRVTRVLVRPIASVAHANNCTWGKRTCRSGCQLIRKILTLEFWRHLQQEAACNSALGSFNKEYSTFRQKWWLSIACKQAGSVWHNILSLCHVMDPDWIRRCSAVALCWYCIDASESYPTVIFCFQFHGTNPEAGKGDYLRHFRHFT